MPPSALIFSEALIHRLAQLLYRCLEDLGSTKAALYLTAPGEQVFHLVSHYGWPRITPPPAVLEAGDPMLLLARRERRGLVANDASAHPELAPFSGGAPASRFYLMPIYDQGEWVGLLLQRDLSKGDPFKRERQEPGTEVICEEIVQALHAFGARPGHPEAAPEGPAEEAPAIHVPSPPSGTMIQVEERLPQPEGEAMEHFHVASGAGFGFQGQPDLPEDTLIAPRDLQEMPSDQASEMDSLFPEQRTFFWEAAGLLCQMVPAAAVALFINDESELRPILTYSRVPLGPDLKHQIMATFLAQFPDLPKGDLRLLTKAEWFEREPLGGPFRTLLPVMLEGQFGDDDLLMLMRIEDQPFSAHEQEFIRQVSRMLGLYLQEGRLHERYHQSFLSVSHRILASTETRLPFLKAQSVNTAELSRDLARRLELPSADVEAVSISAILHDVGTLLLDKNILDKPTLSEADFEQVQTHPILASTFLKDFHFPFDVLRIIRHHHERWDGAGYPDGIQGEAIPIGSRIIHLVESYEVMTTGTSYRAPKPVPAALQELEDLAGSQFDPSMVGEFIQMLKARHLSSN
jgi:HD-GYP domain-containing protein (c-di-GMP phosphodiesterase class II)